MITKRVWVAKKRARNGLRTIRTHYFVKREGWFLFGLIPIFIQDISVRDPHNVL